jgi:hypothetical protein
MSGSTPTLIPRPALFPPLIFLTPQPPAPIALPRHTRVNGRMHNFRDLAKEMEDLSAEEDELEDMVLSFSYCRSFFILFI